jgi:4-amino-4-deoxy-L-arabinose transferase-like glycosyltransferase
MIRRAQPPSRSPRLRERPRPGPWLLLLAVAFGLRALFALAAAGPGASPSSDGAELDSVAWNLAHGAGYSLAGPHGFLPTAAVPPLVPWLVSLLYRWFGHRYLLALLFQCAIGSLVPLLVASLGAATFGVTVGRVAAWLSALSPALVMAGGRLQTPIIFGAALLVSLGAAASWVKTPRPARALGVGITFGLASLAQSGAIALPLIVAGWAWAPLGLTVAGRDRMRQLALMGVGLALVVAPWAVRNVTVLNAPWPLSTAAGRHLLEGNNPVVWSDPALRGGAIDLNRVEPYASELRSRSETGGDAFASAAAIQFLAGRVGEWPAMAWIKIARLSGLSGAASENATGSATGTRSVSRVLHVDPLALWSLLFLPLALYGLARTIASPRRWFQSLSALVILYFMCLAVVFHGGLGPRVPIEPLMALFAAEGLEDVRRRVRTRARGLKVIEGRRSA